MRERTRRVAAHPLRRPAPTGECAEGRGADRRPGERLELGAQKGVGADPAATTRTTCPTYTTYTTCTSSAPPRSSLASAPICFLPHHRQGDECFLRRGDVEHLIRRGDVQHILQ